MENTRYTRDHLRYLTRYGAWANRRLYGACSDLPAEEYRKDRAGAMQSIRAVLNHVLAVDRVWLARLNGTEPGNDSLHAILYDGLGDLWQAREIEDRRLIRLLGSATLARLDETLAYPAVRGKRHQARVAIVLAHLFNHASHHRGQVHDLLTSLLPKPPAPVDLMSFTRDGDG